MYDLLYLKWDYKTDLFGFFRELSCKEQDQNLAESDTIDEPVYVNIEVQHSPTNNHTPPTHTHT